MDLMHERRITHLTYLEMLRAYATRNETQMDVEEVSLQSLEWSSAFQKIDSLDLWAITDPEEIEKFVDEAFREANQVHMDKALANPEGKHFNRFRNAVITASKKRVSVKDAADGVLRRLQKTK